MVLRAPYHGFYFVTDLAGCALLGTIKKSMNYEIASRLLPVPCRELHELVELMLLEKRTHEGLPPPLVPSVSRPLLRGTSATPRPLSHLPPSTGDASLPRTVPSPMTRELWRESSEENCWGVTAPRLFTHPFERPSIENCIFTRARETDTRQPLMQYKLHVNRGTALSCADE